MSVPWTFRSYIFYKIQQKKKKHHMHFYNLIQGHTRLTSVRSISSNNHNFVQGPHVTVRITFVWWKKFGCWSKLSAWRNDVYSDWLGALIERFEMWFWSNFDLKTELHQLFPLHPLKKVLLPWTVNTHFIRKMNFQFLFWFEICEWKPEISIDKDINDRHMVYKIKCLATL